ncbi:MAG: hypothetical protein KAW14_14115 [Candidatus Aegiribacteria sp.]|nr:hypothetical protein [Candidatus Aegiribacteria sp.]
MKYLALIILLTLISLTGCRTDYDIEEVAPPEHLGGIHEHDHAVAETEEHHEHDDAAISGSNRHVHEAGARNHGTEWFFNQPWAARFIWSKMIRDTVILAVLAAIILLTSRYRLRKKR